MRADIDDGATAKTPSTMTVAAFAASLAIVSMIGIDIYVPALGAIQADLRTSAESVALSIPAYFAGTFASQLFYGRKPVLMFSLLVFCLGTLACVFAASVEMFLLARFVQAFGVCGAAVLWQPIVTDSFPGDDAKVKTVFGFVMPFIGISPALAPLLGGWVTLAFGWRLVFVLLLGFALLLSMVTLFGFAETRGAARGKTAVLREAGSALARLAAAPTFYIYAIAVGLTVGAYMSYLTIAPFSLAALGYSPLQIGLHFLPLAAMFGLGGAVGKWVGRTVSEVNLLRGAAIVMVAAGIGFHVVLSGPPGLAGYMIPFGILSLTFGIIPNASAMAVQHFRAIAGTCSSGMNFTTSLAAFASTLAGSLLYAQFGNAAMTATIMVNSIGVLIVLMVLRQRGT